MFLPEHHGGDPVNRINEELRKLLKDKANYSVYLVCGQPDYVRIIQEEAERLGCMDDGEYIFIDVFNMRRGKLHLYPWQEYQVSCVPAKKHGNIDRDNSVPR